MKGRDITFIVAIVGLVLNIISTFSYRYVLNDPMNAIYSMLWVLFFYIMIIGTVLMSKLNDDE